MAVVYLFPVLAPPRASDRLASLARPQHRIASHSDAQASPATSSS